MPAFADPQSPHLATLLEGLRRRVKLRGEARSKLERELVQLAGSVVDDLTLPLHLRGEEAPPRRVAVAFALALHCQPQFAVILGEPFRQGAEDPGEPRRRAPEVVPVPPNEVLERVLGLAAWEIDDLREEVDRRAGAVFKRDRAVAWLWSWAGKAPSATLAAALFPGVDIGRISLVRRGGHLFAMNRDVRCSRAALWLPWLSSDELGPGAFRPHQVDEVLRRRLCRGVGAEEAELDELLGGMVAMIPRGDAKAFLHLDQWRIHGRATVADLGRDYRDGVWLTRPIPPDGPDWGEWLVLDSDGALAIRGTANKVFDTLALPRAAAMMRQVYAGVLSTVDAEGDDGPGAVHPDDLDLYDLETHLRVVLEPLFNWARDPHTHRAIATAYAMEISEVDHRLLTLEQAWREHAARAWWGHNPSADDPSILTLTLPHVLVLHASLRRLVRHPPHGEWAHGDLLLLFVAHYLREARLERLWMQQLSDVADGRTIIPPPEDIAGRWFWSLWTRTIDEMEPYLTGPGLPHDAEL